MWTFRGNFLKIYICGKHDGQNNIPPMNLLEIQTVSIIRTVQVPAGFSPICCIDMNGQSVNPFLLRSLLLADSIIVGSASAKSIIVTQMTSSSIISVVQCLKPVRKCIMKCLSKFACCFKTLYTSYLVFKDILDVRWQHLVFSTCSTSEIWRTAALLIRC